MTTPSSTHPEVQDSRRSSLQDDLQDIQRTIDRLVQQLSRSRCRRIRPHGAATLLAAISYKLGYLQRTLRR